MNNVIVFKLPLAIVAIAVIAALHIVCAVLGAIRSRSFTNIACIALAALNAAVHLGLIIYAIFKDVPTEELLCLLMISAAVGTVSMGISEKHKKAEEEDV